MADTQPLFIKYIPARNWIITEYSPEFTIYNEPIYIYIFLILIGRSRAQVTIGMKKKSQFRSVEL